MHTSYFLRLCWVVVLLCGSQATAQNLRSARLQAALDSVYSETTQNRWIAGISAAVRYNNELWTGVVGFADTTSLDTIDADMRFRYYSTTKTFTAAAILHEMALGNLSLDDKLGKWRTDITNPNIDTTITLRQLLLHQSGFPDYVSDPDVAQDVIANTLAGIVVYDPLDVMNNPTYVKSNIFPGGVGSNTRYSSTNYILLGLVLEAVTGRAAESYFRDSLLGPAGLTSTYFYPAEPIVGNMPVPYDDNSRWGLPGTPGEITRVPIPLDGVGSIAWTTGALVGTPADLSLWPQKLFKEAALIHPNALDSLLASLSNAPTSTDDTPGYGIFPDRATCANCIGHGGAAPGFRALMAYDTASTVSVAVMINQGTGDPSNIGRALMNVALEDIASNTPAELLAQQPVVLGLAYPNPASNGIVQLPYRLATPQAVRLTLYDAKGQLVATLLDGQTQPHGSHTYALDTQPLAAGLYFYRLETANYAAAHRLLIEK